MDNDLLTRANREIDLPALIGEFYPASGARAGRGGSIRAVWRGDKNPSGSVFQHQGVWLFKDHGKGVAGNAYQFLIQCCDFSPRDAAAEVKRRAGLEDGAPVPFSPKPYRAAKAPEIKPPLEPLESSWYEFLQAARDRLDEAEKVKPLEWYGISKDQAQQIGLGVDTDGGLVIPIYDTKLEIVTLKKRLARKDAKPKYVYITEGRGAPAWVSGTISDSTKLIVVVEGEMNAITLHLMLETAQIDAGVIGIAGAEGSAEPLAPTLRGRDVLIFADDDSAGERARERWYTQIKSSGARAVAQLPKLDGVKDFAELHQSLGTLRGAAVVEQMVLDAEPLLVPEPTSNALGAKPLDLESPIPDVEWIVRGMIPQNRVSIIAAMGGVGKSSLVAHLAACLNTGRDFLGFTVAFAPVLVVDYEDEVNTFRRWARWVAAGIGQKLDTSKIQHIEIGTAPMWQGVGFPAMVDKLIQELPEPTVVVVDAFESAMQIDSNKAPEVLFAMAALNKLARAGHTVIVLDHLPKIGKGQSRADVMPTGSVQKTNQARAVIILEDVTPEGYGSGKSILKVRAAKMNLAKRFDQFGVERTVGNDKATFVLCELPELDSSTATHPVGKTEREILEILDGRNSVTLSEIIRSVSSTEQVTRRQITNMERQGKVFMTSSNPAAFSLNNPVSKNSLGGN